MLGVLGVVGPHIPGVDGPHKLGVVGPLRPGVGGPPLKPGLLGSLRPEVVGPQMPGSVWLLKLGVLGPQRPGLLGPQKLGFVGMHMAVEGDPEIPELGGIVSPAGLEGATFPVGSGLFSPIPPQSASELKP